jgi:hypothetical protein
MEGGCQVPPGSGAKGEIDTPLAPWPARLRCGGLFYFVPRYSAPYSGLSRQSAQTRHERTWAERGATVANP